MRCLLAPALMLEKGGLFPLQPPPPNLSCNRHTLQGNKLCIECPPSTRLTPCKCLQAPDRPSQLPLSLPLACLSPPSVTVERGKHSPRDTGNGEGSLQSPRLAPAPAGLRQGLTAGLWASCSRLTPPGACAAPCIMDAPDLCSGTAVGSRSVRITERPLIINTLLAR